MTTIHDRRTFLGLSLSGVALSHMSNFRTPAGWRITAGPNTGFPRQDPEIVEEMVRVAHNNPVRVRQLLDARPALCEAAVDWGFGDWEEALGGPSHLGNREIANLLISRGAKPTLFSAAMLGQLDVVKAFVAAVPGCQRLLGPHSITLLSHARAGGPDAKAVRDYLEALGDADLAPSAVAMDDAMRNSCVGTYKFGPGENDRLEIAAEKTGLTISRPGLPFPRGLRHLGNREFFPQGAEAVRIRFSGPAEHAATVGVYDPDLLVTASRV